MNLKPISFICEQIEVLFSEPPVFTKKPGCPDGFYWRDSQYIIAELISEWFDYRRSGHMSRNMRSTHAQTASQRGSWGVGQFYFRVRTEENRIFDLYFDRAPKDVDNRKGAWFLDKELVESE